MAEDIKITFDTLFSLLRVEKSREEIQELDKSFFDDVTQYLNEKKELLTKETEGLNIFMDNERERTVKQLSNIKRILNEIYERREKKIIEMALVQSRTKSNLISTAALLDTESGLYEKLVKLLDNFRDGVLYNVLEGKKTEVKQIQSDAEEQKEQTKEDKVKKIKFLSDTPKFVGENLEVYGPYEQEETAELPTEIADLLVLKGRAQEA